MRQYRPGAGHQRALPRLDWRGTGTRKKTRTWRVAKRRAGAPQFLRRRPAIPISARPAVSRPDVVILAGEINTGAKAVAWAAHHFTGLPVLYVHGNHEGYGHHLDEVQGDIEALSIASGNVHFLHWGAFIQDQVCFLSATMWTDFQLFGDGDRQAAMREAEAVMSDYQRIRLAGKGYRKLRAADTARFHAMQKSWLIKKLEEPFTGKPVVITHMAPSMRSVTEQFAHDKTSASYASRLDELAAKADLWVHGHMHDSSDYLIGKCRVVCNPCVYMTRSGGIENEHFNPNFIIEV